MHILLALLGVIGGLIFFLYRLSFTYRAGKDIVHDGRELASDAKAMVRRSKWNRKKGLNPIDDLIDPRQVATVLMIETAKCAGEITSDQKSKVMELIQSHFQMSEAAANEMMISVAFMTRDVPDIENVLSKILRPIHYDLTEEEKRELITMMCEVASLDGLENEYQSRFVGIVKNKILSSSGTGFAR